MHYYQTSILKRNLEPLTYQSEKELQIGSLVTTTLQNQDVQAVIIKKVEKPNFTCNAIKEVSKYYFSNHQLKLAQFIATYYVSSLGKALDIMYPLHLDASSSYKSFTCKETLALSKEQKRAKQELESKEQVLLFGDTGSGKSEIYMSIMEDILKQNKNIIFLMPEISLTPQMKKRLTHHFGSLVAIWHSKVTKKQKEGILSEIKNGEVRIIAGARSALFLPLQNVGLIVVDEEHDDSYKSSSTPRYNAKDLSLMYGKILNAKVLLGSATPSLTSYHKLPHVRVKGTFFQSQKYYIYENKHNEITPFMLETINKTLQNSKQIIVFVPTRANFKYLTCKECGTRFECPYCSISMSLHQKQNTLRCHYCNFATKIPHSCHKCGSTMIESSRIGTVEVAKQLQEVFLDKSIEVFDKDAISTQRKLNTILKRFNNKEIDILVGTQMLSKGHDYHDVGLSVIMGLDSSLALPDFRSREKTLALALQIAGRSGRKGEGAVFLQTQNGDFFHKYMQNYDNFLEDELLFREELYPPYQRLLQLLISHKNEEVCKKILDKSLAKIHALNLNANIVGSGKSNIEKIANKYRYHILLRSTSAKTLLQIAFTCKTSFLEADMDPLSFT